jgi:hypothetical protein
MHTGVALARLSIACAERRGLICHGAGTAAKENGIPSRALRALVDRGVSIEWLGPYEKPRRMPAGFLRLGQCGTGPVPGRVSSAIVSLMWSF